MTFLWNGKTKFDFNAQMLQPKTGTVTLTLVRGVLTVISVKSYQNRVVEAVSDETKTIYYKDNITPTSLEDQQIQYRISRMGTPVELVDLERNDILSIAQSEDGMVVDILISTEQMTGTITQISEDGYAIDGMSYPACWDYAGKSLELGKKGTFYFNVFGEIVHASYDLTELNYAYLLEKEYEGSLLSTLHVKLLTMAGKIEEKTVAQKVEFNGQKTDVKNMSAVLTEKQLLKVQYNSDGEVRSIETAYDNTSADNPVYDSEEFSKDVENKEMRYRENLFSDGTDLYCTTDSTPVMVLAINKDGNINDRECIVSTVSNVFYANTKYSDMIFYDVDADTRIPKIIVRMKGVGAASIDSSSDACVIEQIYQTVDQDGMSIWGLCYYKNGQLCKTRLILTLLVPVAITLLIVEMFRRCSKMYHLRI